MNVEMASASISNATVTNHAPNFCFKSRLPSEPISSADILRPPIRSARDHHPGVEHSLQRLEMLQHVLADSLREHIALAPRERHAGGRLDTERRVTARLFRFEKEDVLQNPVPIRDVVFF